MAKRVIDNFKLFIDESNKLERKKIYNKLIIGFNTTHFKYFNEWFQIPRSSFNNYFSTKLTPSPPKKVNLRRLEMIEVVNEQLPVVSGRDYRLQTKTTKRLFDEYTKIAKQPMSLSTYEKYINTLKIHHSNHHNCPVCDDILTHPDHQQQHFNFYQYQRRKFVEQKQQINAETALFIVLDFSKINDRQDLIISILNNEKKYVFHHLISDKGIQNDHIFVINVFDIYIKKMIIENEAISELIIWSDGGRKHFKNATIQHYIMNFITMLKLKAEWNFFVSYHGYNPCDLSASILKRKVKNEENNNKKVLTTPEIIDLCNSIACHSSITYKSSANTTTTSKMKNISYYHCFRYIPGCIQGFILFPDNSPHENSEIKILKSKNKQVVLPYINYWKF